VTSVAFSSDGESIVSASCDNTVRVWNASTGEQVHELKGHTSWVISAAFSSDSKSIVSASLDMMGHFMNVLVWNASTGAQVRVYEGAEAEEHEAEAYAHHRRIVGDAMLRTVDKYILSTKNAFAASNSAGLTCNCERSNIVASYSSDRFALQYLVVL
jgi:WD40 repeat protein